MVSGYNRMYCPVHPCGQATWWRKENETDLSVGDINWEVCYDALYVLPPGSAEEHEAPRAVPEDGRSNRDLNNPHVVDKILSQIRRTGLWLPLANVYWNGLGKFDLGGQGRGRTGENSVGFLTGADTDRF